jgi:hypothetical protein
MDRGVGVTIDRRSALTDTVKVKEIEGEPLLNANALKALIRLLRLAQVSFFSLLDDSLSYTIISCMVWKHS